MGSNINEINIKTITISMQENLAALPLNEHDHQRDVIFIFVDGEMPVFSKMAVKKAVHHIHAQ